MRRGAQGDKFILNLPIPWKGESLLKAVLFDLDGTLINSEKLSFEAIDCGFREVLGRPLTQNEEANLLGRPVKKTLSEKYPSEGAAIYESILRHFNEKISGIKAYPGVIDLLDLLSAQNVRMAVVTSGDREVASRVMESSGIGRYFEFFVGQDDTKLHKPDPEPIFLALKKLGLFSGDCIFVGDQPYDIMAAKSSGMDALAAVWGAGRPDVLSQLGPKAVIEKPMEVSHFVFPA